MPNISELKEAIARAELLLSDTESGCGCEEGTPIGQAIRCLISYASQQAEQETLSEEEIETILTYYGIAGRPEIAKALVGKIPYNGSGRIGETKYCCCDTANKQGKECPIHGKPHFNSMAELKRKYMEATDREARYKKALTRIVNENGFDAVKIAINALLNKEKD